MKEEPMSNQESGLTPEPSPFAGAGSTPPTDAAAARVTGVALDYFAEHGYEATKLENIARDAGMSKRMIHYHFGDKRGLYEQAVVLAIKRLHPTEESIQVESTVPVEGVRVLVDAVFNQFLRHPEAVRMLVSENLNQILDLKNIPAIYDESTVKLHVDRLLLAGQDAGAFRPGISADDLFVMITSLAFYRVTNKSSLANLLSINLDSPENVEGAHRMLVDAVLAFLTSNIPNTGQSSYLQSDMGGSGGSESDSIYDLSDSSELFDES